MFIAPMLLEKATEPFYDKNTIWEPKLDGHRMMFSQMKGKTTLYTRHQTDCTVQYPEISQVQFDRDIVLDGEVCCTDPNTGLIDFERVMARFHTSPANVASAARQNKVSYLVWDILFYDGQDLRSLPLLERKEILARVVLDTETIAKVPFIEADGIRMFDSVKAQKMEGSVCKTVDSPYHSGKRMDVWKKLVAYEYATVYISGFLRDSFGWLVSLPDDKGRMRSVGVVKLAVPAAYRKSVYPFLQSMVLHETKEAVYVEPRIPIDVKFRNWTSKGLLRLPEFVDINWALMSA